MVSIFACYQICPTENIEEIRRQIDSANSESFRSVAV